MINRRFIVAAASSVLLAGAARASESMRSPHSMEMGKVAVSVYGVRAEQENLTFRLGGASLISVPLQGGGTAQFFANSNTDLEFDGEAVSTVLQLAWRPAGGLHYVFKVGTGDYDVRVPSGTVENVLENSSPGRLLGFEAGWTILPDTPVSPAIGVSLGYTRSDYGLRRLRSGGNAPVAVDQDFSLEEWQGAASVSNRWGRFEPYAGLRFMRQTATLRDNVSADRVRGHRDGISPYAGLRFEFFPREALVLEAAFLDETVLAAGVAIGF
jgi:hypothetical protein